MIPAFRVSWNGMWLDEVRDVKFHTDPGPSIGDLLKAIMGNGAKSVRGPHTHTFTP